jgi:hypothetical protein
MSMRYKIFGRHSGLRVSELAQTGAARSADNPGRIDVAEIKKTYGRRNYVKDACRASYSAEWAL